MIRLLRSARPAGSSHRLRVGSQLPHPSLGGVRRVVDLVAEGVPVVPGGAVEPSQALLGRVVRVASHRDGLRPAPRTASLLMLRSVSLSSRSSVANRSRVSRPNSSRCSKELSSSLSGASSTASPTLSAVFSAALPTSWAAFLAASPASSAASAVASPTSLPASRASAVVSSAVLSIRLAVSSRSRSLQPVENASTSAAATQVIALIGSLLCGRRCESVCVPVRLQQ